MSDHVGPPSRPEQLGRDGGPAAEPPVDAVHSSPAYSVPGRTLGVLRKYQMLWILGLVLVGAVLTYHDFFSLVNLRGLFGQNAALGLAAVGATFVILSGGFDLSVGGVFGLGAVIYASLAGTTPIGIAIVVVLAVGAAAGAVNGLLITVGGVNPFVATLGTGTAFTGFALLYSNSLTQFIEKSSYLIVGTKLILGFPIPVWILLACAVAASVCLAKTVFGRSIYAIGGNGEAARLAGMRVQLLRASVYVIAGGCSALAGLITAAQAGSAQGGIGVSFPLDTITVVIIGGTSLAGGEGAIWKTMTGLLIIASIRNVFAVNAIDPAVQSVVTGAILVGAVALDAWARRYRS